MVAATVSRPRGERQKDAIRCKIPSGVVAGGRWQESRAIRTGGSSALMTEASHRLCNLLPAGAMTEWTIGTITVDRNVNDTRSERGDLVGPKPELTDGARTIALREDVSSLYERLQARHIILLSEIQKAAALPMARIKDMLGNLG